MKNRKRFVIIVLSLAILVTLLAGCGRSPSPAANNSNSPDISPSPSITPSPTKQDTPPTELLWYVVGPGPQADVATVQEAVSAYVNETYGLNIKLEIICNDYGSNSDKMQMVISSQEEFDICWTSSWNNNYYNNVNKNAFLPLDELLTQYAPELYASIDRSIWDGTRVGGQIYGVPSIQIMNKENYATIVKEYADQYNLNVDNVKSLADLDEFFHQVKADNPNIYPFAAANNGLQGKINFSLGYEEIAGVKIPGAFKIGDDSLTVVNQFELESVQNFYRMMYQWSKDGIVRQDAATISENAVPDQKAGIHVASVNAAFKPGVEVTESGNFGDREVVFAKLSAPYMATSSVVSSLNSISRTSKNPELAMQFLNYVNTDAKLYNLICFGVEGTHYTVNSDGTVSTTENSGYDISATDWVYGNQFNAFLRKGQASDTWEKTIAMNDSAVRSKALGFSFDSTSVTTEIAAVSAVVDQYFLALDTGAIDPDTAIPEMLSKMKAAGSDAIIAEMQKQVNAWK